MIKAFPSCLGMLQHKRVHAKHAAASAHISSWSPLFSYNDLSMLLRALRTVLQMAAMLMIIGVTLAACAQPNGVTRTIDGRNGTIHEPVRVYGHLKLVFQYVRLLPEASSTHAGGSLATLDDRSDGGSDRVEPWPVGPPRHESEVLARYGKPELCLGCGWLVKKGRKKSQSYTGNQNEFDLWSVEETKPECHGDDSRQTVEGNLSAHEGFGGRLVAQGPCNGVGWIGTIGGLFGGPKSKTTVDLWGNVVPTKLGRAQRMTKHAITSVHAEGSVKMEADDNSRPADCGSGCLSAKFVWIPSRMQQIFGSCERKSTEPSCGRFLFNMMFMVLRKMKHLWIWVLIYVSCGGLALETTVIFWCVEICFDTRLLFWRGVSSWRRDISSDLTLSDLFACCYCYFGWMKELTQGQIGIRGMLASLVSLMRMLEGLVGQQVVDEGLGKERERERDGYGLRDKIALVRWMMWKKAGIRKLELGY